MDLGSGTGVLALLAARWPGTREVVGVEIQAALAGMSARSVALNGLESRVRILRGDWRDAALLAERGPFDVALSNPPYRPRGAGRLNPDPERATARHEIAGDLRDWAAAARRALRLRGRLYAIYLAGRTQELLAALGERDLRVARLRAVHSRADEGAEWVLVEAVAGGKQAMEIEAPWVLYDAAGALTAEARAAVEAADDA